MDDTGLEIKITAIADCDVVKLDGELDCQTALEFGEALERLSRSHRRVVIDLSGLKFIDSSGLHVLMSSAETEQRRRIVVCPPGNVARVLSIVRAEAMLALYDDLDEAVDAGRGENDRGHRLSEPEADGPRPSQPAPGPSRTRRTNS